MSKLGDVFGSSTEGEMKRRLEEVDYAMTHMDDEDFVELALVNAHHSLRRLLGLDHGEVPQRRGSKGGKKVKH